jgi:vacuolar protein sorting-associated protein 13A/C
MAVDHDADGSLQRPELHQHTFELNFSVDELQVAISKIDSQGQEKSFGHVTLQRFALAFALAKFDMSVDVNLR